MRIALGGIAIESCTFTSLETRREDFAVARGDSLLALYPFLPNAPEVEFVPTLRARALPGGPVRKSAYEELKREFLDRLKAGRPWDGVYLDLHGAMSVTGREDAEGDWIESTRRAAGAECLLFASYDLHGNVSPRVFEELDLLTAYRTAPHTDEMETRERAVTLLLECLRRGIRPRKAFVPIPILLSGERTSTVGEPAASLYAQIPGIAARDGILDASLLVGYAWADEPRTRACAVVYGTDELLVTQHADGLAESFWSSREDFTFSSPAAGIDESIRAALAAPEECVFLCDSGDNPTAGGVGDLTHLLARLLAVNVPRTVLAAIADAEAVRASHEAGVGAELHLALGGKLDPSHGAPFPVRARVIALHGEANRTAVLLSEGVKIIVTERRTPFHRISQFQELGIEPLAHQIVAVKIGYLEPDLARAAPKAFLVLSPGAVDQDLTRIPYRKILRPIFPLDPDLAWRAPA